jgi:1-deoxy-D-xylulose-5-phosphate reductoisomerase
MSSAKKHMPKYAILVDEEAADNLRKFAPKGVEGLKR